MFGTKAEVDPVRNLIGLHGLAAIPEKDAIYLHVRREDNGKRCIGSTQDVPVDGFWSISVYNPYGYFDDKENLTRSTTSRREGEDGSSLFNSAAATADPNCSADHAG